MIPYTTVSPGIGGSADRGRVAVRCRPDLSCMLESGSQQVWQSAGSEEMLVLWVLGWCVSVGRRSCFDLLEMLLPSRTVWMTIASVGTLLHPGSCAKQWHSCPAMEERELSGAA
jgi:hypothetical protein